MTISQTMAGAAALTSSATPFSATVPGAGQTFVVADATGYPSTGRFTVQLNRALADEEKVLITSRSGTTFTVETRGYDGTTAQSHTNPTVNLIVPATVVNALIDHVDDQEADPHSTKLLNTTRHDTTTRHALSTVIPVSATTPATIVPDGAGTVGTANAVARSDHNHPLPAAVVGSILPDDVAAEGSSSSVARADHTHGITAAVAGTIAPDDAAAEGSATSFARSDHKHAAPAATAIALSYDAASSEGNSTSFARANHVHATSALPWGILKRDVHITDGSGLSSGVSDFSMTNVAAVSGRVLRVGLSTHAFCSAADNWEINLHVDTVKVDRLMYLDVLTGHDEQHFYAAVLWEPSATDFVDLTVEVVRISGSGTIGFTATATKKRVFFVEDIGLVPA